MSSLDQDDTNHLDCNFIHCWSGPRCVSTSLMYSFAQRKNTHTVLDEPLYAHYLRLNPSIPRPYRDLVMQQQDSDGDAVLLKNLHLLEEISGNATSADPSQKTPLIYAKHMAKHRAGIDKNLLLKGQHVLLIRSPEAVIASFSEVLEPTLQETCYVALLELYSELRSMGKTPPVILSEDLVADPEGTLRALCKELKIEFDPAMLSWPAGPKPEIDGCWAPWWYGTTHASTGFGGNNNNSNNRRNNKEKSGNGGGEGCVKFYNIEPSLRPLLEECRPIYEFLRKKALRPLHSKVQLKAVQSQVQIPSSTGTHAHSADPRNENILIGIRDGVSNRFDLVWRPEAKVSVLDSGFMLGDGVWEGIRVHKGVLLFIQEHLDRLYEGAKALDMDIKLTPSQLEKLIYMTLDANGMGIDSSTSNTSLINTAPTTTTATTGTAFPESNTGIHIRLMVTRGLKSTPYQHPNVTIGSPTIVIIPEYKEMDPVNGPKKKGITLFTSHVRRGQPDVQDPNWNSHSKLNCIAACIQASKAGADEALMLDPRGFVATCNSTNFFIVRKRQGEEIKGEDAGEGGGDFSPSILSRFEVWAPTGGYQLRGITRSKVIQLCTKNGISFKECDFSLTQVYSAEEAFVTGTFAGQIHVREIDGRKICSSTTGGTGSSESVPGPVTQRLQRLYAELCEQEAAKGRRTFTKF